MTTVKFQVDGQPEPQGSKTAIMQGGRARVIEGSSTAGRARHKKWRAAVADAAQSTMANENLEPLEGPLSVYLEFFMEKPVSKPKWKIWPDVKPDIDKLIRSILDSLTGPVFPNDSQVVLVTAYKYYAIDRSPGCCVEIITIPESKTIISSNRVA